MKRRASVNEKGRPGPRSGWQVAGWPSMAVVLGALSCWIGVECVAYYLDVRGDVQCSGWCAFKATPRVERPGYSCEVRVGYQREPDGFLWHERLSARAFMDRYEPFSNPPFDPGPGTPAKAASHVQVEIPLSDVSGVTPDQRFTVSSAVVWTVVTSPDVAEVLRAGGTLVRPCPGLAGVLARLLLAVPLVGAGTAAVLWGALALVRRVPAERRRRRGLCAACGYNLRGIPEGGTCPECGGVT